MPNNVENATACDQVQNVATVPWLAQAISQSAWSQSPFYFRQKLTAGADMWICGDTIVRRWNILGSTGAHGIRNESETAERFQEPNPEQYEMVNWPVLRLRVGQ